MGHATWDNRAPQPDPSQVLPISLTLRLTTGGPDIEYPFQQTDDSGFFTVSVAGLPNGTYYWRAKGPQYLATSGNVTLTAGDVHLEMGTQTVGDANNDNCVGASDFNIVKNTFGKSLGDPGYDARADFTGDDTVSVPDFNLLKGNFGLCGAPPISPGG